MIYTINEEECGKNDLTISELLGILLVKLGSNIPELFATMERKQMIKRDETFGEFLVTQRWDDVATTILLDSDPEKLPETEIDDIAIKLMEIFPKGKKDGTAVYWRGNKRETMLRLKKFFKLYGNSYSKEEILEAARQYVEGFNGVYRNMRVLKYFIWKDDRRTMEDGTIKVIEVSDLANCLENMGQEESLKDDWTSSLK